jgi:hypothetical protein
MEAAMALRPSREEFDGGMFTKPEIDDLNRRIDVGLADIASGNALDGPQALDLAFERLKRRHGWA